MDGALFQSQASIGSFKSIDKTDDKTKNADNTGGFKPPNVEVDFHGTKPTNKKAPQLHRSRGSVLSQIQWP